MTFQKNILTRAILATGLVAGLGLSQMALAEPAQDDLTINAGLAAAMSVSCGTPLSFGLTRVKTGNSTSNTVNVNAQSDAASKGTNGNVITNVGTGTAGECTISGSAASVDATVTVTIAGQTNGTGTVSLAGASTDGPSTAATLTVSNFITFPSQVEITAGDTTFKIGGTLTIPGGLVDDNLGNYTNTVTVEVDDGFSS